MKKYLLISLLVTLSFSIAPASAQLITTVAGNGTWLPFVENIPAISAPINNPYCIATDDTGNIYIALTEESRVCKVSVATGLIYTIAGIGNPGYSGDGGPATNAQLSSNAMWIAMDHNHDLYIQDDRRIRKVDGNTGIISTVAGTGVVTYNGDGIAATAANLSSPQGIAADSAGNLYIADDLSFRLRRVDVVTGIITTVAGNGTGGFSGDGGPATDAQMKPTNVTIDRFGNLYISESNTARIRKVDAGTGMITTIAGTGTNGYNGDGIAATAAQLHAPYMTAVDDTGNLYIGDAGNRRVRKVSAATGLISTLVGTGTIGYNGDCIAADTAMLYAPDGLAFDTSGHLYVSDEAQRRVHKLIYPPLVPAISSNSPLCPGQTLQLTASTILGIAYHWSGPNGFNDTTQNPTRPNISVIDSGTYTLISGQNACADTTTVHLVVTTFTLTATGNSPICDDSLLHLSANAITGATYAWSGPQSFLSALQNPTRAVSVIDSGDYIVVATLNGCHDTAMVHITIGTTVVPTVAITATPGTNIAAGTTVTFTATAANGGNAPAYQWQNHAINIPGQTNSTYTTNTLSDHDTITCMVHSNALCAQPDSAISNKLGIHITTGIAALIPSSFNIYPNPANSTFTITSTGDDITHMVLTDVAGRQLMYLTNKSKTINVNMSSYPAGTYFIRVNDSVVRMVRKE